MSENIPESVPTSADPKSRRPIKKARAAATPAGAQSQAVEALFERQPEIHIPESATRGPRTSASLAPPPEIVANVQGSSAGAGSGEFHVYKAARRREYERIRLMEEESQREEADKAWLAKQEANRAKDDTKLSKNQKRRQKAKENKTKTTDSGDTVPRTSGEMAGVSRVPITEHPSSQDGSSVAAVVEQQGILIHED